MYQFAANVQGNWDYLFNCLKQQDADVKELTKVVTEITAPRDAKLDTLTTKMEMNHQQLNAIAAHRQQEEECTDQLTKAMKVMITEEIQKVKHTLTSEVRFMVEQLQRELQGDIQETERNTRKEFEPLYKEIKHSSILQKSLIPIAGV